MHPRDRELDEAGTPSAADLVRQWQAGVRPEEAFRGLFEAFKTPLAGFFAKRGCTDEECRDLTQEVFVKAYRGMDAFRSESGVGTWIFKIARHTWINHVRDRSAGKRSGREVPLEEERGPGGALKSLPDEVQRWATPTPLREILVEERQRALRDAVGDLPAHLQQVVLLRLQGRGNREISVLLRIKEGTVKSRLSEATRRLREVLQDQYPEPIL